MASSVVDDAGARERRVRLLLSRTEVYFLLPRAGYLAVWGRLTAALDGLAVLQGTSPRRADRRQRPAAQPPAR